MPVELLVVEDDPDIRETLLELLRDDGFAVRSFSDAVQALSWLDEGARPAAILLDYHLPVMDGLEFCRRKQDRPLLAPIPVVLITADVRITRANPANVTVTVNKPFSLAELLDAVHLAVAKGSAARVASA